MGRFMHLSIPNYHEKVHLLLFLIVTKEIFNMGIFFWDFGDVNDIQREWVMFIVNIGAFIFTFYSLIRTARYHGKILFELLPLSINAIATLILLFIKLFQKGYQFDLVGYAIQIFTYFLFCYTFTLMHSKLIATHRHIKLSKQQVIYHRFCNVLFICFAIIVVVFIILIMSSIIQKDCDNDLKQGSIAGFITELASYVPTMYFGIDIIQRMTKKHEEEKSLLSHQLFLFSPASDQYIKQRKKQIKLVLGAYTVSLVLRAIILVFNLKLTNYFDCMNYDGVKIITSNSPIGQTILVLVQVNQLIPHLIIPIALYVIPVKKTKKSTDLTFQETLIFDESEESHHIQASIQRKVSSSILKRSISPQKKPPSETDTQY